MTKQTVFVCTKGELPVDEALEVLTDDFIDAGNYCEQTTVDLANFARRKRSGELAQARRLITDSDGHLYLIPLGHADDFYRWVEWMESSDGSEMPSRVDYQDCQVSGLRSLVIWDCEEI